MATKATHRSATNRLDNYPRIILSMAVLGVFLLGNTSRSFGKEPEVGIDAIAFDQYEVVTGTVKRQTVLTGFVLGSAMANIVTVDIEESRERRLRIYAFNDGAWPQSLSTTLSRDVLFVDIANIGGCDRLVTYEPGSLNCFDLETGTERALLSVSSSFDPPRKGEVPHVDITRDVNGDGRDDFVVPDTDGFWVIVQLNDGAFADPAKIGPATDLSRILGADGYRYDPWSVSRIFEVDIDQDGRNDLVFWNQDHFEAHVPDDRGLFITTPKQFTTTVKFDSDRLDTLITGGMTGTVLHSLSDMNSDGIADLVVSSLTGKKTSRKQSAYRVHHGVPSADGGTTFAPKAATVFQTNDSVQLGMDLDDFDGDGESDVMITTIPVRFLEGSLWKELKGAMGDDVLITQEFYLGKRGRFSNQPDTARVMGLDGAPSHREPGWIPLSLVLHGATHQSRTANSRWPRAFNPNLMIGDVTGDGRADLISENTFRDLPVMVGVPGPNLFAARPQSVNVVIPHDREYSWLVDLNQDGKQDVVMHHPFTKRDIHGGRIQPPGTEPHRIVMLIAR